ncbi:MAG: response regulator [Candidatus Nealsonbacteria bacterium]
MKKIILVEDDPFLIDIYGTKLKESGFELEIISNGSEVISKVKEIKPDIVILDIVLPQMDGWEILKCLRAEESLKYLKIIILSNLGQREEVDKGIALGATGYLIKAHFTPSEVVEEIKKHLNQ